MALQLSTGDFVAIACTVVQVLATIGITIWAMYRSSPHTTARKSKPVSIHTVLKWLRWVVTVSMIYGVYVLWTGASSEEPVTKGYLFKSRLYSFSVTFNLLAVIVMSLVDHFLDRISSVITLAGKQGKRIVRFVD